MADLTSSSGTDFDDPEFGFKEEDKPTGKVCNWSPDYFLLTKD